MPQTLFKAFEASRAFPEFSPPQYGWGRLFFRNWFRRGPLRAGHGIPSSTGGISEQSSHHKIAKTTVTGGHELACNHSAADIARVFHFASRKRSLSCDFGGYPQNHKGNCEGFIRCRAPRNRLAGRFGIEIGSNHETDVESMSNRC